ncbi:MAG TPA: inositol monophosphatase family protein [Armatimonadota bacterium]|nr:inositol monophosphatase family protein [Armatimonadota bacterium]
MDWMDELATARRVALLAGEAILRQYARFTPVPDAPATITTDADRQAQDLILELIAEEFPDDAFLAEEPTEALGQLRREGRRLWVIDPIDGTRGFARKTDDFCTMVALAVDGVPVVGVVHEPVPGRTTWAVRGGGCLCKMVSEEAPRRVRVSSTAVAAQATVVVSRGRQGRPPSPQEQYGVRNALFSFSCGTKMAMVARGEADFYLSSAHAYSDWDLCAGHLLVEEAGGTVSDGQGGALIYGGASVTKDAGIIATNGRLHTAALQMLRR